MAPKKKIVTKPPVQKPTVKAPTAPVKAAGPVLLTKKPTLTPEEVHAASVALMTARQNEKVVELPKSVCASIKYVFTNGQILYADGRHAKILFEFLQECEQLCTVQGFAAYNGDPLERFDSAEDFAARGDGPVYG